MVARFCLKESNRVCSLQVGRSGACVSLTLDEVMHIRQVLTRAKLEKFQSSPTIYQALKNEKVKERFDI